MLGKYRKFDKLITGVVAGAIAPMVWYVLLLALFDSLETAGIIPDTSLAGDFRQRTCALVAICLNIAILQIFRVRIMYRAMQGVVFPTVALIVLWLVKFGSSVL